MLRCEIVENAYARVCVCAASLYIVFRLKLNLDVGIFSVSIIAIVVDANSSLRAQNASFGKKKEIQ